MKLAQRLILPLTRREVPGWGKLYNKFVGDYHRDAEWASEPIQVVRGKFHGYDMDLNLSRWSERMTFFLGRFYDLDTQLLTMGLLREGDRFVDVGANIGMISLVAARRVGGRGVVDAFEPNPACAARIRSFVERNRISQIRLHEMAAGDAEAELTLTIPRYNSGEASLTRFGSSVDESQYDRKVVPVRVVDSVLADDPRPVVLLKMDVEGYECFALRGLTETLRRDKPVVVTEVSADALEKAGDSPAVMADFFKGLGYEGWELGSRKVGRKREVDIIPVDPASKYHDAVWIPAEGPARARFIECFPALAGRLGKAVAATARS